MGNSKRIVFIFGAGASSAITEKVPLMDDFFQKAAEYLKEPEKYPAVWLAFIMIERYRLFRSPNPYLENLAMFILNNHWLMLEVPRASPEYDRIEKLWRRWVELYYENILKDHSRCNSNMETVFGEAEKQRDEIGDEDAFVRLIFAINTIFCELRKDSPESDVHNKLSEMLKELVKENRISVISFNYEIWLERAMQKAGIWSPRNGYGVTFDKFIDIEIARQSNRQSEAIRRNGGAISVFPTEETEGGESSTVILKPHGSLSWFHIKNSNDYLILLDKKENNMITDNEGRWYLEHIKGRQDLDFHTYEPLLIPPTTLKRRHHNIFWRIDKRIEEELLSADIIIVIGWSAPATDVDLINKIKHIFEHRSEQLQKLIICDIKKDDVLYLNFESIFRPITPVIKYSSGFSEQFLSTLNSLLRR